MRPGKVSASRASTSPPPVPRSTAARPSRRASRARSSYDHGGLSSEYRRRRCPKSQPLKGWASACGQAAIKTASSIGMRIAGPLRGGGPGDVRAELLEELLFRVIPDHAIGLAAVLEQDQRRDRTHPETTRGNGIGVDVEFRDPYLLALLVRYLLEDRSDHPAGAAPSRPEIDEHRSVGFDDLRLEVLVADYLWLGHERPPITYHLNANCWPVCSTSGDRPRTGSSKSSATSGRVAHDRSGPHLTKRQPRRRTTSAMPAARRSLNSAKPRRSSAMAKKRKTRSSSGTASPSAMTLRWSRAVHSSCQRNTIRPLSYQAQSKYSRASERIPDSCATSAARSASVMRSPSTPPRWPCASGSGRL